MAYIIPKLPLEIDLETKPILKQLNLANKKLAELKGVILLTIEYINDMYRKMAFPIHEKLVICRKTEFSIHEK